jgi:thioredoxin 1
MGTGLIILVVVILILFGFLFFSFRSFKKKMKNYDPKQESNNLVILNDNTFYNKIAGKVALVDFWAEWCQPCRIQGPIVSELADEYQDNSKIKICKFDVERNKKIATKLQIRNIPTIIIFKNGKEVERLVGIKTKGVLKKAINRYL